MNKLSFKDVGNIIGRSAAQVSYLLSTKNDIRLSSIEQLLESKNWHIKVALVASPDEDVDTLSENAKIFDNINKPRTAFLRYAMHRANMPRKRIADIIGIQQTTIRYWTHIIDDVYFEEIFLIAKTLNYNVKIKLTTDNTISAETDSLSKYFICEMPDNIVPKESDIPTKDGKLVSKVSKYKNVNKQP